jgi:hypothetical protein
MCYSDCKSVSKRIQPERSQTFGSEGSSPSTEKACRSKEGACGLLPYNPGAIPEPTYAPSKRFRVDAQQLREKSVQSFPVLWTQTEFHPLFGTQYLKACSAHERECCHTPVPL